VRLYHRAEATQRKAQVVASQALAYCGVEPLMQLAVLSSFTGRLAPFTALWALGRSLRTASIVAACAGLALARAE
jgi:hypothetical protein